jgi:hypothetical protein
MIHLFNSVFLEEDRFTYQGHKNIMVSELYATPDVANYPLVLASGKTLNDVLDGKTIGEFLKSLMLYGDERVVIYADNVAFATIITAWLKSTTNMDQESFDVFTDCYAFKCSMYSRPNEQLGGFMKAMWSTTEVFDFLSDEFTPSVEFALASAFYDRNFSKKEYFKVTLSKFIKREYEQMILEARKHLDTYILDNDLQTVLGGSNKTLENFRELPRMSIYREPFFKDTVETVRPNESYNPGRTSKLDIGLATDSEITELCAVTDDITMSINNSTEPIGLTGSVNNESAGGWHYIMTVKNGTLTDSEYNSVIDDILNETIAIVHIPSAMAEQVLFVFLPYIKTLKQENKTALLQKFTLK